MSREGYELTGQKIQGYTISKPIGQGKFSIVYRAQNEQGEPFALKKIKIFDMADQRQREKCLREVDIMKKLNHPHIIQYIDSFIHNNQLIIVTEWAQRGDLKKLIKEKQGDDLAFDEATVWNFMRQIASALKHMHQKRIMHRDLKPANIFIHADQTLKIGDLGLGRSFSSQTLEAYSKVGTPLYMSPELIQDSGYTQNADVWSLGCICYQLAELKSPFRNKEEKMSLMDLFNNITQCNYKPLQGRYSPQLREAISNMIVVDPAKRWSSDQVLSFALRCIDQLKRPLLDPFIAMDDISIKLTLLDYEKQFCKVAERKPINRLYFAIEDRNCQEGGQLNYFLQLSYWVMALSKPEKKRDKLALTVKALIDWSSAQAGCKKLLVDVADYGLKVQQGVSVASIRNQGKGYGEGVCYLLNQLLTRELIRMNFQFKPPADVGLAPANEDFAQESPGRSEREIEQEQREQEESLEEESQFEQSILFNKNNRRDRNLDGLIEKIQQIEEEENRMMIVGRADEREWRTECLRLQKKLADVGIAARDARKKGSYSNVETARICQAVVKLTDLTKYVRPAASTVFRCIEDELQKISKGEKRLIPAFQSVTQTYAARNQQTLDLSNRSAALTSCLRDQVAALEKTEQKLSDLNERLNTASIGSNDASKLGQMKGAISSLRKEIVAMDQKREIVSWQIRRSILRQKDKGKDDYLQINYLQDQL